MEMNVGGEAIRNLLDQCLKDASRCVSDSNTRLRTELEEAREALHAYAASREPGRDGARGALRDPDARDGLGAATGWRRELGEISRLLEAASSALNRQVTGRRATASPRRRIGRYAAGLTSLPSARSRRGTQRGFDSTCAWPRLSCALTRRSIVRSDFSPSCIACRPRSR